MFAKLAGIWLKDHLLVKLDILATVVSVSDVDVLLHLESAIYFTLAHLVNWELIMLFKSG